MHYQHKMRENMPPNHPQNNIILTTLISLKPNKDNKICLDSVVSTSGDSSGNVFSKPHTSKFGPSYYVADSKDAGDEKEVVAVIGSGMFGRALALKIAQSGYHVYIGSRNPEKQR